MPGGNAGQPPTAPTGGGFSPARDRGLPYVRSGRQLFARGEPTIRDVPPGGTPGIARPPPRAGDIAHPAAGRCPFRDAPPLRLPGVLSVHSAALSGLAITGSQCRASPLPTRARDISRRNMSGR